MPVNRWLLVGLLAWLAWLAVPVAQATQLKSHPGSAYVYQLKQGKKLYLGQAPLSLSARHFHGDAHIRIMLHKLGFESRTVYLPLNSKSVTVALKKKPDMIHIDQHPAGSCARRAEEAMQRVIYRETTPAGILLADPIEIDTGRKIVRIETRIFETAKIRKIAALKRKRRIVDLDVELKKIHRTLVKNLRETLKKSSCVHGIELIAYIGTSSTKFVRAPYLEHYNFTQTSTWDDPYNGTRTITTTHVSGADYQYENRIVRKKETYFRRFDFGL